MLHGAARAWLGVELGGCRACPGNSGKRLVAAMAANALPVGWLGPAGGEKR